MMAVASIEAFATCRTATVLGQKPPTADRWATGAACVAIRIDWDPALAAASSGSTGALERAIEAYALRYAEILATLDKVAGRVLVPLDLKRSPEWQGRDTLADVWVERPYNAVTMAALHRTLERVSLPGAIDTRARKETSECGGIYTTRRDRLTLQ